MYDLEANVDMRTAIKTAIENGLPTYAECGGLMYLARSIEWTHDHQTDKCSMVGSINTDIIMEKRPQGRGYVQLQETENSPWPGAADNIKNAHIINAHEFHYSRFKTVDKNVQFAFHVKRGEGINGESDGYVYKNLLANYTHQRNTRNNPWAQRFIEFARNHKT